MIAYEKKVLSNGMVVLAECDSSTALAAISILYKVGSRNESPSQTGMAHLFEHLMFGGTWNTPDFDTPLQYAGGENNAFTNSDYTNFYDVLPAQNIETAFWLEADRMSNLILSADSLNVQKKVVIEEFKEVCLNQPYGDVMHHVLDMAYEKHPYNWPTIGKDISHVANVQLDDVRTFYRTHYHPSNAVLSITSPFEPQRIFDLAEKWFGDIPAAFTKTIPWEKEPDQKITRYKTVQSKVPHSMFILGFHVAERNSPSYFTSDLLSDILANGRSSRFYSRLVKNSQIMSHADCYITGTLDPGLLIVEGKPMPGVELESALDSTWVILNEIKDGKLEEYELQKAKNKIISSLSMSEISPLNRAITMAYYENLEALEQLNEQESMYMQVTVEDIVEYAKAVLIQENMSQLKYLTEELA
jgi:predicted Zn-dependent peptidase